MADPMEEVLRQVASGELSPEDAEPIIAALSGDRPRSSRDTQEATPEATEPSATGGSAGASRLCARPFPAPSECSSISRATQGRWASICRLMPTCASCQAGRTRGTQEATAEATEPSATGGSAGRAVRIRVQERGRTVVNVRIPMSWTGLTSLVPGLSSDQVLRVSEALRNGERGPILDIQDADGDGVVISTE